MSTMSDLHVDVANFHDGRLTASEARKLTRTLERLGYTELLDPQRWAAANLPAIQKFSRGRRVAFNAWVIVANTETMLRAGQYVTVGDSLEGAASGIYPTPTTRTDEQIDVWDLIGAAFDAEGFEPTGLSSAEQLNRLGHARALEVLCRMAGRLSKIHTQVIATEGRSAA